MAGNGPRNPCELEIDLFCRGLRIDSSAASRVELAQRTRAGLGSGLELVLPGRPKDIWVNAPVTEAFAFSSPYHLVHDVAFAIEHERNGFRYPVRIDPFPCWYQRKTGSGVRMDQIGVLQGTYLGIYIGPVCRYWRNNPRTNCAFCTTGLNEVVKKSVADVVETCQAARQESGVTFVHLNSGYQEGRDLRLARPFIQAIKKKTDLLVGVQMAPVFDLHEYDELIDMGVDHFSFCFEFMNRTTFGELCPGKAMTLGQPAFFRTMEYTASRLGKGRVSGEIIAGVEPLADTFRAIEHITDCGAFPTICVFRPLQGSDMEHVPPPEYEKMKAVFQYMIQSLIRKRIPIGIAPNIEVSLVVQPTDALYLAPAGVRTLCYRACNGVAAAAARTLFHLKRRNSAVRAG